jgi:tetratricopeptide (TPR) repeat protein
MSPPLRADRRPAAGVSQMLLACLLALGTSSSIARADLLDEGLERLDRGDLATAQRIFEELHQLYPDSAVPLYYQGLAASHRERPLEAANAFAQAAALDPAYPWLQASLGIALYRIGELDAAEAHLLEALVQGPDDADVLLHLGLIDLSRGEYERAIRLFEEAAALDLQLANLPLVHAARAELARGDLDAARLAVARAVEARGSDQTHRDALDLQRSLGVAKRAKWLSLAAGAGLELDDNLTVIELDGSTGVSDIAGVFDLSVDLLPVDRPAIQLAAGYDFYQSVYREVESLNFQSHSPYALLAGRIGRIRPSLEYRYANDNLGGADFMNSQRIRLNLAYRALWSWRLDLGGELEWLDFAEDTERDARRVSIMIGQRIDFWDGRLAVLTTYRPEWQDARDPQLDYFSNRFRIDLDGSLDIRGLPVSLGVGWEYAGRDYSNITRRIRAERRDRRHLLRAGLRVQLLPHCEGMVDYVRVASRSNLPELDYDENILTFRVGVWY